jgi:hypothetical protein
MMKQQNNQITHFVATPCFTCFITLLQSSNLSCYTNNVAMFQGMRTHVASTCCTNHNSQAIMYETNTIENVAYTGFKWQLHDEMDDAHVYEMNMQFMEVKHLGCYSTLGRPYPLCFSLPLSVAPPSHPGECAIYLLQFSVHLLWLWPRLGCQFVLYCIRYIV